MARTAKTHRLTALALKKYAEDSAANAPLHDGGGLYLRKRDASLHWVLSAPRAGPARPPRGFKQSGKATLA